jgi:hypothetical protein
MKVIWEPQTIYTKLSIIGTSYKIRKHTKVRSNQQPQPPQRASPPATAVLSPARRLSVYLRIRELHESITVSTHASARASLPVSKPPRTHRFSAVSGRASQRYNVGCVSDRSGKRVGERCQEIRGNTRISGVRNQFTINSRRICIITFICNIHSLVASM